MALTDIRSEPEKYGVTATDVDELQVTDAYTSAHNQVTHVYVRQAVGGTPVAGSLANVNVDRDSAVVHFGSRLVAGVDGAASGIATLDAVQAVGAAATALDLETPTGLELLGESTDGDVRTALVSDGGISSRPIPAALTYQATEDAVQLAWVVEIEQTDGVHWWVAAVDAETGALLDSENLVINEKTTDRAERADEPVAGPAFAKAEVAPAQFSSGLEPVPDGARYRVFPQPLESPNDGPRTLVTNPADQLDAQVRLRGGRAADAGHLP